MIFVEIRGSSQVSRKSAFGIHDSRQRPQHTLDTGVPMEISGPDPNHGAWYVPGSLWATVSSAVRQGWGFGDL